MTRHESATEVDADERARRRLEEGDRLHRAGDAAGAVCAWSEGLGEAEDEALRLGLSARLGRANNRLALRRLVGPVLIALLALPPLGAALYTLSVRAEDRRREDARVALDEALAEIATSDPREAIAALASVAARFRGSPEAEQAERVGGELVAFARDVQAAADEARTHVARGRASEALARLDAALTAPAFPTSPVMADLARLRDDVARVDDLRRGKEALEERDLARARSLFERHPDVRDARRGEALARAGELTREAESRLAQGDLEAALARLREVNDLAARAGQTPRDLSDLEARDRELRRVRAALALHRAAARITAGELVDARAALEGASTEDETLARRLAALGRVARDGVPEGMVLVPGGHTPRGDVRAPDELPLGLVDVEPFLIDRCEVTVGEYARFLEASGRGAPPGWRTPASELERARAVTHVTHEDACAYAAWVGKRLPTEIEWEAAARLDRVELVSVRDVVARERFLEAWALGLAKASRSLEALLASPDVASALRAGEPFEPPALEGDLRPTIDGERVVVSPAAAVALLEARRWPWGGFFDAERCPLGGDRPVASGAAGASPWGVEDLAGGVGEWTASEYVPYEGPLRTPTDGKGRRVVRGGSFRALEGDVRAAARAAYAPTVRFDDLGFRCARGL